MLYPVSKHKDGEIALNPRYLDELSLNERMLEADGVRLYYVHGDAADRMPTLVFLHGTTVNHTIFKKQIAYFRTNGYGIIAPDLRGDGKSEPKVADEAFYSLENRVADLDAILDREKTRKPHVLGHSMGAMIAAVYVAETGNARTAALIEGSYDFKKTLTNGAKAFFYLSGMIRPLFTAQNWTARKLFGIEPIYVDFSALDKTSDTDFAKITYERASPEYVQAMHALSENVMTWNVEPDLEKVTVPTLILGGGRSQFIRPEAHYQLKERIGENAKAVIIPDAKHQLLITHADEVNRELEKLISSAS